MKRKTHSVRINPSHISLLFDCSLSRKKEHRKIDREDYQHFNCDYSEQDFKIKQKIGWYQ